MALVMNDDEPNEGYSQGTKIIVMDYYDGFGIQINGKDYNFDQEDNRKKLVQLFKDLGYDDVTYEEVG